MPESKTIVLPKGMSVGERIAEANRQISEWIDSLKKPYNEEADALQMKEYKSNDKEYKYRYTIERNVRSSGRILSRSAD
jgi:hypothetical protein